MIRKILSVIAGLAAGVCVVFVAEKLAGALHPMPQAINTKDTDAVNEHISNAPLNARLVFLSGYALAALVAGLVATLIVRNGRNTSAMICAVFFMCITVVNFINIPSPVWMWIVGLVVWIPFSLIGYRLALKIYRHGN